MGTMRGVQLCQMREKLYEVYLAGRPRRYERMMIDFVLPHPDLRRSSQGNDFPSPIWGGLK